MSISTAFFTVLIMLLYAIPGFIMSKTGLVKDKEIPVLARLLMYVCQPALVVSSMSSVGRGTTVALNLLTVFAVMFLSQGALIGILYLFLKKKTDKPRYRIYILACAMGNCSFMGIPILEALLPDNPEAVAYSAAASLALNVLGWTVGSAVIMKDKKFISAKKIFLNPTTVAAAVALSVNFSGLSLPEILSSAVNLVGKMSTPLCMIIMGMRLATVAPKNIFANIENYAVAAVKQFLFPALILGVMLLLPTDSVIRKSCFIMLCCPSASVVLNFSEMLGNGQKTAAGIVLLSTVLSIASIPLMILLI